jgi:hypothetical protein
MAYINTFQTDTDSFGADLSGSLRTTNKIVLANYKSLNFSNTIIINSVGTGTDTLTNNIHTISVTSGQFRIRQSRLFHPYYPGNTQLAEITFRNFQHQTGVTKRVGYFSSSTTSPFDTVFDGVFLETNGTTYSLNIYNSGSLIASIPSTSWNNYKLIEFYDWSKFTVIGLDFLWLGGAGLRFFMVINGKLELIHTYAHAGISSQLIMRSPNQPIRYEIRGISGSGSFDTIGAVVSTEGFHNPSDGYSYEIKTDLTGVSMSSSGVFYPILMFRRKSTNPDNSIEIIRYSVYNKTNTNAEATIIVNPTITGTPTWVGLPNSSIEYAIGNGTTIQSTGGFTVDTSTLPQRVESSKELSGLPYRFLQNIDGTRDVIAIVGRADANNTTMVASVKFLEV